MKVLAILGSPRRKGNTYRIVEKIKLHLAAMDKDIAFEEIWLADYELKPCRGCFSCFARGQNTCPLRDDHAILEEKMNQADGIIFAAPTYAMGVPALMKNFIDRFAYTSHRPFLFDKAFMAVSTVGGIMGLKQAMTQLSMLASGGKSLVRLGVMYPPVPMASVEKRTEKQVSKASKAFYRSLTKGKRKVPGLADWAYFSSFKAFCETAAYQEVSPADYAYYRDKAYFYPVEGHPLSLLLGKIMKGLMGVTIKRMTR